LNAQSESLDGSFGPIAEQDLVEGGQLGYLVGAQAVDDFALLA
jgi:hypothetical protein